MIMQIATWLSVLALGPGSIAIFIWFLLTLRSALTPDAPAPGQDTFSRDAPAERDPG